MNTTGNGCEPADSLIGVSALTVKESELGVIVGTLTTGPTGQIWNMEGKLRRNHRYAILEVDEWDNEQP